VESMPEEARTEACASTFSRDCGKTSRRGIDRNERGVKEVGYQPAPNPASDQ